MGRGKPFPRSLKRLVDADVIKKPAWMDVVEATRPPFRPVYVTKAPPIEYPEDRSRSVFLEKNRFARRIPINMKADAIADRHLADRFVEAQTKLMNQDGVSESDAYEATMQIMKSGLLENHHNEMEGIYGSLSNGDVMNEAARLYLASLSDSRRDRSMYQALKKQAIEESGKGSTNP